eukprot:CAMPEP_0201564698 /NCGR_PEP_ID=MMETSP0190_2-20130828/3222_1 /ASSEMBLY_ACC=CAM_ASM_000263 /TAXON_ID=37353 /ORGANISM="Rosalina sp." /LENGTH=257 /DNA_ID=CAMNT_0047981217 /DNA_START=89 /DNA_END=862 /DNA_ORIENTATION=+
MTIQLQAVEVLDNPAPFTSEFKFRITFDCIAPGVKEELEWKLVYVGSADNEDNDQELDSILVGPVRVGKNRFTFTAPPPDVSRIPSSDLLDVTVVLLTCLYKDQEFIRIGYYVHNEYSEEVTDSTIIKPEKIIRNILSDKPRVTRFNIAWDNDNKENTFKPLPKKENQNDDNEQGKNGGNEETKDNDNDDDQEEEEEEEVDLEATDDEQDNDDEDIEEDVIEQQGSNDNNNNNNNANNKNGDETNQDEEDDDIDMTE